MEELLSSGLKLLHIENKECTGIVSCIKKSQLVHKSTSKVSHTKICLFNSKGETVIPS